MSDNNNLANPAPLGLLGFGMTTVLLNIHNAGFFEINAMILAMGIFYGGIAQIFAGLCEFKKGNTFGTLAFTSYGLFWLTLVFILVNPWGVVKANHFSMAMYFIAWGVFTFFLFLGTRNGNKGTQVVFGTLTILFALLAIRDLTGSEDVIGKIAGWEGIFCGLSAMYVGLAETLNEKLGREVMPLG
ncbi:MAG: acetate uptake transporter [Leptospirales bacterium]|nr:acetate uptake transporter [Leptospirales bacterium]